MLEKHKLISSIIDTGIVAIIRADNTSQAESMLQACISGGLPAIEITFTVVNAPRILEKICQQNNIIIGAGTILDAATARIAILAGASYIVSPCFDVETAKICNRYAVPYMPGCYTPTEMVQALEYGVDIIKLFPANCLSFSSISTFKAPLPQINIMPTGGINTTNAADWIKAGAIALGVGGDLVSGPKEHIIKKAQEYRKIIAEVRKHIS